jgi:hypothetical protein
VNRGADIPASQFSFSSVIARGPVNPDGSTNDTIKVVIYGTGSNALAPGSYSSLVRFGYDVVNISDPDVQNTHADLAGVLGSTASGVNAGIAAGANQAITVNNRTLRGDVNNDDHVDILDMLMIVDHILNRITLTGDAFTRADVAPWPAGDGAVNVQDLALVQGIILSGQYPDGSPLGKPPVEQPIATGQRLDRLNPGVDAKVTFYLTAEGIAVRLENAKPVKGIQLELGQIPSIPATLNITSALGSGFSKLSAQTLRVLLYDQSASVLPEGDRIVAYIPFALANPQAVTLENVVIGGSDNLGFSHVETEFSYTAAEELPTTFMLSQNFPNPFNPTTSIRFSVPQVSDVRLTIYNMIGQEVRTLFAGQMDRGTKVVSWDGLDNHGRQIASGMYVYRMVAGSFVESHKMMLLK